MVLATVTVIIGNAAEAGKEELTTDRESYVKDCALAAIAEATSDATAQREETTSACRGGTTGTTGTGTITEGTRDLQADRHVTTTAETTNERTERTTQIHQGKKTLAPRWDPEDL